jgi:hypothetical protein
MKNYIILALLIGFSLAATCPMWACGSLTAQCVGQAALTDATVTVQACPANNYCSAILNPLTQNGMQGLRNTIVNTAQTCAEITPNPVVTYSGMPGDICAADTDCKNGFKCQSKACRNTAQQAGFTCATDLDCDLGFWCDTAATKKCVAVVAPGGACTNAGSPSTMISQCGF